MVVLSLIVCSLLFLLQVLFDRRSKTFYLFNPKYAFEAYYIIALPLSLFISVVMNAKSSDIRINRLFEDIDTMRVSCLVMLGFVCFIIGVQLFSRFRFKPIRFLDAKWKKSRIKILIPVMVVLGYVSFFLLMKKNGGMREFLANIQEFRNTGLIGQGFLIYPATGLLRMCFIIYILTNKDRKTPYKKIKTTLFLVVCGFPSVFLGFRSVLLCILLEFVAIYHTFIKRIKTRTIILVFFLFVFIFVVYGVYRELTSLSFSILVSGGNWAELLFNPLLRVRGGEILGVVIRELDKTMDFQFGYKTLIEALTIIVPHSIWPNKPIAKSVVFSETFFGLNGGVSPTVLTELYWDFGLLGVSFGMLFLGSIFSLFSNTITNQKTNASILLFAEVYYQSFLLAEAISGPLNSFIAYLIFFIIVNCFLSMGFNMDVKKTKMTRLFELE